MKRRGVVAASVLVAWGAGLGLLMARELNPSSGRKLAEAALRVVPQATYYLVERDGRHIGFASIAIDTVPRALQVTEYLVTDSAGTRLTDQQVVRLSRGLALRDFESTRTVGSDTARVTGHVADSSLVVTRGAAVETAALPGPTFAGAIASTVAVLLDDPRVGATTTMHTVDPPTGRLGLSILRIDAESLFVVVDSAVADSSGRWFAVHRDTVRAWRLRGDTPAPLDAWVDAQGLVVEATRPDGLVLRRTAFELAFENWRMSSPIAGASARARDGIVTDTWLASGAPRPDSELDSLLVKLGGTIPGEFAARFGRQWRPGNTIVFTRTAPERLRARYTLPTSERWQKSFTRNLAPAPGIEADDPAIARRAARLAAGDTDPSVVIARTVAWIGDSLRADASASPFTASTAMTRRAGDAREFALLLAAMARAAGIPAYPVAGLLQLGGRFYLHAWTRVYLGRWVPIDAMLGQVPADASHLEFLAGDADLGPDLARLLSRLPLSLVRSTPVISTDPRPISPAP